jgi:DNA polymerase-4
MIAHFDLDAFFVSVECLLDPSLRNKPLIVGGSRERGVVTACSYETRKFGVHSAMPMARALQLCPQAIVVKGSRGEYSRFSRMVTNIIAERSPLFEKASIDEFYIDLRGMERFHKPYEWTIALREHIIRETGLNISFGLSANKLVSKIATDQAKPNGYLIIPPGQEQEFLAPLKVNKIPGVGDSTYRQLLELGVECIGDLLKVDGQLLEKRLGKYGIDLVQKAMGRGSTEISAWHEAKSISTENTFHENTSDVNFLMKEIVRMTEKVAYELREENKMAGVIAIKLRYPDFETVSKQASIPYSFYDDELIPVAKELFHKLYRKGEKVRLLGVRLTELTNDAVQTNLFSDKQKKAELYKAIDGVRKRFGKDALGRNTGSSM